MPNILPASKTDLLLQLKFEFLGENYIVNLNLPEKDISDIQRLEMVISDLRDDLQRIKDTISTSEGRESMKEFALKQNIDEILAIANNNKMELLELEALLDDKAESTKVQELETVVKNLEFLSSIQSGKIQQLEAKMQELETKISQ